MTSDPFRIRDHVADFDDIVRDIIRRSETTRSVLPMEGDIAYGQDPTETVDLFFPVERRPAMPVHIFIHGGYWRMFSKRDYSYVADTVTRAGAIAVIVDYALMPRVRMATIVDQVRRAKRWVVDNIARHGGDPARLTVSGHSAGAHLATFLFNEPDAPSGIEAALLLGGLYELKPLQASFLEKEIGITDDEVAAFSPRDQRHDVATRVTVAVGADETPPFHAQADAFAGALRQQGLAVARTDLADRNHMNSVRDLGVADSAAARSLVSLIQSD
ncbi:alpha/beta hydrolase [Kaistia dalseonensis]|uniref:Arylformamidase n=1 Tax=Kaistia dalseonensis TaxID=410840 RepID=A0ABU0H292_9HYPH|nr:alpha/beta hydrolase [Kaistia dalseonensis]MCX5493338.1 alpha/beta hydrolase [Kaistia dalseonensis]MDQ0435895.1 arylformamidase [Kaistia dalseonensis]